MNVEPPGFDKLVLDQLAGRAAVVGWRRYADLSHVATFDFTQAPQGESNHYFERTSVQAPPPLGGCVGVRPAKRW
jgi:hypothetical protein